MFEYALEKMGVSAAQTVYVGNDMFRDIYGARQVGMRTVMFDSDQGTKEYEDCAPDYRITDHRELLEILGISTSAPRRRLIHRNDPRFSLCGNTAVSNFRRTRDQTTREHEESNDRSRT